MVRNKKNKDSKEQVNPSKSEQQGTTSSESDECALSKSKESSKSSNSKNAKLECISEGFESPSLGPGTSPVYEELSKDDPKHPVNYKTKQSKVADTYVDITDFFRKAVDDNLKWGDMVTSEDFSLCDSMSAIEILDYKMDSGFRSRETVNTVKKAKEHGLYILPTDPFEHISEVIRVCDELLNQFQIWIHGRQANQTIYSCVWFHDDVFLESCPLFCLFAYPLICSMRLGRKIMMSADVFDDEETFTLANDDLNETMVKKTPKNPC